VVTVVAIDNPSLTFISTPIFVISVAMQSFSFKNPNPAFKE